MIVFFRPTSEVDISETVCSNYMQFNLEKDMIYDNSHIKFPVIRTNRLRDIDLGSWPKNQKWSMIESMIDHYHHRWSMIGSIRSSWWSTDTGEGTLYPVCPGTMYPHCPPGDQSGARKSMTTNHSPPWGAVRVHCTQADRIQCTLTARADRVHCTRAPRYNAGGARFDCPDCLLISSKNKIFIEECILKWRNYELCLQ